PIIGNAKARSMALTNSNASVFTINYDNLVWLIEELGERWPFGAGVPVRFIQRRTYLCATLPSAAARLPPPRSRKDFSRVLS
ncbi:hypothetical protein ACSLOE_31065, partial [Escherichia coli]